MNYLEKIIGYWSEQMALASQMPWMKDLSSGNVGLEHYKGFLIETYHNAGLNPQLQAFASIYIPGRPRALIKKFYQHAISEIGHDVLALNDLDALGVDKEFVICTKPLPITSAFYANATWGIQKFGVIYYLGYLFHLEFTPTQNGRKYIEILSKKGIPENALTFLEEHTTVDIAHNKLMEMYIRDLIKTSDDFEIMKESLRCCVNLHTKIIGDSFANGEHLFAKKAA